jgi:hypothetical protein
MHPLATAIIEHTTATGVHYDWLIEDPSLEDPQSPHARLWTARVYHPPAHWAAVKRLDLQVLPPHRRAYLTYQGPVSGDRGRVRRIASGVIHPLLWTPSRLRLSADLDNFTGIIDAHDLGAARWLATAESHPPRFTPPAPSGSASSRTRLAAPC